MKRAALIWSFTALTTIVGFLLTIQLTSRTPTTSSGLSSYIDLRTQIEEQTQEHQALDSQILKASGQVSQYQTAAGHSNATMGALQQDAANVAKEAGLTDVNGNGIRIQIAYDPTLPFDTQTAGLFDQIADQEIGLIVNDLYANGATAISINGQRLVTTSSIRLVTGLSGNSTLQINTVPITMPYVITAVGDVKKMQAVLTLNNTVEELNLMQEQCIITPYTGKRTITVPRYQGPLPGSFAKEVH